MNSYKGWSAAQPLGAAEIITQALAGRQFCRPARAWKKCDRVPGVALRSTPGYELTALSRAFARMASAKLIGSSQSRVAKMEAADRSVSIELLIRSLAALGASQRQIGKIVATKATPQAKSRSRRSLSKV